jgi:hypothetical protein
MKLSNRICCWNNCTETAEGDLPSGWVNLFVYESPQPLGGKVFLPRHFDKHRRDGVLCAQHAFMLDRLLMPLQTGANQGVTVVRTPETPKSPTTMN